MGQPVQSEAQEVTRCGLEGGVTIAHNEVLAVLAAGGTTLRVEVTVKHYKTEKRPLLDEKQPGTYFAWLYAKRWIPTSSAREIFTSKEKLETGHIVLLMATGHVSAVDHQPIKTVKSKCHLLLKATTRIGSGWPPKDHHHFQLLFLASLAIIIFPDVFSSDGFIDSKLVYPFSCSDHIPTCNSYLYHISDGLSIEQIASSYSVSTTSITMITYGLKQDYLVPVPCSCKDMNGSQGYFYDTSYRVQPGDTFANVTWVLYSGQAWQAVGEEELFVAGNVISLHLICGCTEAESEDIVTYTVQGNDTLTGIADLLSSDLTVIKSLNGRLTQSPTFIDVGWVLFIPRYQKKEIPEPKQGKIQYLITILATASAATLFSVCSFMLVLRRRNRNHKNRKDPKAVNKETSFQSHIHKTDIEDANFEPEGPVVYSLKEIGEATNHFDESKIIGRGGNGSVYIGMLQKREVAIKKMKSNRSKEFYSELKVLCKIHHINVVELLGYASGDNHLYLVYEYIQNGSLNDHLHDPLPKGHSPLSWIARAQIALDAARGIEYIHDHTKVQYVHRDIKTSNILLDQGLRGKVSDFGLARLVGRNEDDEIATRLVGTPGYMAPESVRELQMTSKADAFAFGVVLAELITGQRALIRDNQEPRNIKALASLMKTVFGDENPEVALETIIDGNLKGSYPIEEAYKMAELSRQCTSEDPINRPKIQEIVHRLSQILMSSVEWEASLGGSSPIFTRIFEGR